MRIRPMRHFSFCLATLCITLCAIPLTGCIEYRESIRFHADGSGAVSGHVFVPNKTLDYLAQMNELASRRQAIDSVTVEQIAERFRREGIAHFHIEQADTDSGIVVAYEYEFRDLEAFRALRGEGRDVSLRHIDGMYEFTLQFLNDLRDYGISLPKALRENGLNFEDEPRLALDSLLVGYNVAFEISFPTAVVSAPDARFRDNTVRFAWRFDDDGNAALKPRTMRVIFQMDTLDWPTFEAIPYEYIGEDPIDDIWIDEY